MVPQKNYSLYIYVAVLFHYPVDFVNFSHIFFITHLKNHYSESGYAVKCYQFLQDLNNY